MFELDSADVDALTTLSSQDDFGGIGGAIYNEGTVVIEQSAVFSRNIAEASRRFSLSRSVTS